MFAGIDFYILMLKNVLDGIANSTCFRRDTLTGMSAVSVYVDSKTCGKR